jgi:hypothetical protein
LASAILDRWRYPVARFNINGKSCRLREKNAKRLGRQAVFLFVLPHLSETIRDVVGSFSSQSSSMTVLITSKDTREIRS